MSRAWSSRVYSYSGGVLLQRSIGRGSWHLETGLGGVENDLGVLSLSLEPGAWMEPWSAAHQASIESEVRSTPPERPVP